MTAKKPTKKRKPKKIKPDPYACPYENTMKPVGWRCLCINCRGADM